MSQHWLGPSSSGRKSLFSWAYIVKASSGWRSLFLQSTRMACCLALERAGNSSAAKIAITAITTSNSMSVKPSGRRGLAVCSAWPKAGTDLDDRVLAILALPGRSEVAFQLWDPGRDRENTTRLPYIYKLFFGAGN